MAVKAGTAAAGIITPVPFRSRIYGFGSVYAKTLRDSRLSVIIVGGLIVGLMVFGFAAIGTVFPDPKSRLGASHLIEDLPPILKGLGGNPVNLDRIGGYISWKYGPFFAIVGGLWSILALSGTLASEARRGSLDIIAATPSGKRRIAVEKLTAHLTGLALIMVVLAVLTVVAANAFGQLPGDKVSATDSIGFAAWLGLVSLCSGSVAWALAPFLGRASAAGIAGGYMLAGYVICGYQTVLPGLKPLASLTPFGWTYNHVALAGQTDWPSLIPVAIMAVVLLVVGIEAFRRRDLGSSSSIPMPAMPEVLLGTTGPARRAFGERLPVAIAWGIGLAIYAALIAGASSGFSDELKSGGSVVTFLHEVFPRYDLLTPEGFLQLMFAYLGFIIVGLAASTFVSGWASDEGERRLEMLLATPMSRGKWALAGGVGVLAAILVMVGLAMVGIAIGVAFAGGNVLTPVVGSLTLALWAAAAAGVGFAVGGLWRTSLAAEVTAIVVVATFLLDFLGPALKWPDWIDQLALTSHLGLPMVGVWDWNGTIACVVIALGGLLIGSWGMQRRDVGR
jgi:ABC-2 type transport system permease protein